MNEQIEILYAAGRFKEGAALLKQFMGSNTGSVINDRGERIPKASGSGRPGPRPYSLHQNRDTFISAPIQPPFARPPLVPTFTEPPAPVPTRTTQPQAATSKSPEDLEEEEQVKALMASKKGRMVLRNGDVVENGRYLVLDESDEMEKGLPLLSPVLTHWLKTFKSYIPLTAFNKPFLVIDQQEWSRRKAPTESRIDDGNAPVRVYGGSPPPEELAMQFEDWIDSMTMFIKYVGENYGWMIAGQTPTQKEAPYRT